MGAITEMMASVASSSCPGQENWDLKFHVERRGERLLVDLWLWWEPHSDVA